MKSSPYYGIVLVVMLLIVAVWYLYSLRQAEASPMTFFITSQNPGQGGNLGGLAGADNYCKMLAASSGAGDKVWRAYLSASATASAPAVDARDRIGAGPWKNFQGATIANTLEELHDANNITKQTALDEKGVPINGRGDTPNWHDILTGSGPDGRAIATTTDTTCGNWTTAEGGSAMVGHHDRMGLRDDEPSRSWNASHLSRGCSLPELATTGSGGLLYCFAATE